MTTPPPDYTDLIARLEGPASVKDEFSAIHIFAKDARAAAAAIRTLSSRVEKLEDHLENAGQAMSETHPSWEYRCHAIMAALGCNYGGPTPDIPEEHTWYSRNLAHHKARIEALTAERDAAESAIDAMNFTTDIAHHLDDGKQSPADLLRQILNAQNAAIAHYRNARKATT